LLAQLSGVLLPVFALVGIGYGWRKLGMPFEREFVTRIVLNVAGPCLIVDTLSQLELPIGDFLGLVGASAALFALTIIVAWLMLRMAKLPIRSYLPALGIGNTGNLGLPLCLFAFGQEGLGLAVAVYVTNSVGQFTLTPLLQSQASPLRTLVTTPVVYGALIGLVLLFGDIELPMWTASTLNLLGSLMIPLMLLALGNTLGELRAKRLGFSAGWGAARLVLGFGVGHVVAWLFGLEGVAKGVIVLQAAMPAAVFNYLFAARYNRAPDDIAGIVLLSTFLSALTMPFLVAYVLSF
jgi:malate permease and related proteins